jgi:hypothetical protein
MWRSPVFFLVDSFSIQFVVRKGIFTKAEILSLRRTAVASFTLSDVKLLGPNIEHFDPQRSAQSLLRTFRTTISRRLDLKDAHR